MLRKLIGFEVSLHTKQVSFWITVAIMALVGLLIMSADFITVTVTTGERVKANGAITLAGQITLLSLLPIFFGAVFVVTFAGQFAPWLDKESLGPINPAYFIQPTLVFTAINVLFVTAFYTMIAGVSRNRALVYVSAVGLFVVYFAISLIVGEDSPDLLTTLSDPFGGAALGRVSEFWPASDQNTIMAPLLSYIGLNRLVWGGISVLIFAGIFRLFKRGLVTRKIKSKSEDGGLAPTGQIQITPAPITHGISSNIAGFFTRLRYEYLTTVKSIAFIILMGIALAFFGITLYVQLAFLPDPTIPTSISIAQAVIGSFFIPMIIMTVFFGGEIIWRDKVAGITEILDATPVPNWPLMAAKWLALIAVITTILLFGALFGMTIQLIIGQSPVNVMTYLKFTFINVAPDFFAYALLALFVQNFAPNRVVGMLLAAALLIFFIFFVEQLPFYHPLMGFGGGSPGQLSEINGYQSLLRFKWFNIYWGSLCAFFAVLTIWLWRRGLQSSLKYRLKTLSRQITPISGAIGALVLASFVGSGAYIFKAYNIDNEYRNQKQNDQRQVDGEKLLSDEFRLGVPKIRSVEADINMRPSKQEAIISGRFVIENVHDTAITELYVSPPSAHPEDVRRLDIEGAVRVREGTNADGDKVADIENFDYYLYRFEPPLAPGAMREITFEAFFHAPRLGDDSIIQKNGTFVNNFATMPVLGVQDRRMRNPDRRRKYGLPELERRAERTDLEARNYNFISRASDYVDFKAKFCTDIGQIPITPGRLEREYEENGQVCRDYRAIRPILNFFSFMSADFAVKQDVWVNPKGDDVALEIYYHPTHDFNLDLMMDAMKASLDTFTTTFGPYLYSQVRIMEFPYASFAQAFAGTIPFSENIGFVRAPGDPLDNTSLDLATYVTMHEIGHQWFAHQIVPADTKGFNVLSEGLTENAAMTAYEQKLGWQKARRVLETRAIEAYLTSRGFDRDKEPALAEAGEQQYLVYNKASWVFWGLKHYMGKDVMQGAIRGFLEEYGSKGPPYPTTRELIAALREAAGPDFQQLITDYWERITFWELGFTPDTELTIEPAGSDGYTVTFTLSTDKKIASEEDGKETSVSEIDGEVLNEWVEIGFYAYDPKDTLGGDWLALERVRITEAETELSFTVNEKPAFVLLDPSRLLMERNVKDNVKAVP